MFVAAVVCGLAMVVVAQEGDDQTIGLGAALCSNWRNYIVSISYLIFIEFYKNIIIHFIITLFYKCC